MGTSVSGPDYAREDVLVVAPAPGSPLYGFVRIIGSDTVAAITRSIEAELAEPDPVDSARALPYMARALNCPMSKASMFCQHTACRSDPAWRRYLLVAFVGLPDTTRAKPRRIR
ncbi:hypothetical protein [Streptomyces sp. NPDC056387]|uniref:hypothetical protein n=1 Tax=Streptomyces sp. NPDC056387 TaxID=3345803 RepID=UPI0035DE2AE2